MNLLDRAISSVAPIYGAKRAEARKRIDSSESKSRLINAQSHVLQNLMGPNEVTNTGYSHGAASRRSSWAKEYHSSSSSAKRDIEENRKIIRERSRDLAMNSPLGAAAIGSTRTNCIGAGLIPKPKIDYEFLGISKDEAHELQKKIKKEFALWAESTLCDNNDQNNFYELQQIAFGDWLKNGEEFCLIKYEAQTSFMPYQLRLKLVEADRICTPDSLDGDYFGEDKKLSDGNKIVNGVEITKSGKVVAYHVCSKFPGDYDSEISKWKRIAKRGEKTGNPNILHIFNAERAEQYRGVPFLAPVIESIKQLTRYTEAEIMAAVVNAMFVIFIQTENGDDLGGFGGVDDEESSDQPEKEDDEVLLGTGTVNELKAGETVNAVESNHPSGNFDSFATAMATHIGAALEIAPEILLKRFTKNFSASKGALNETWKSYRMRRTWFVNDFCQEVYELWFAEAVSKGRIVAPGFFNDPLVRKAYTNCTWNGPAQGQLDPGKEVDAAIKRVKNGFSTHEDECTSLNGSDFEDNVRTLENENELLMKANKDKQEDI